MGSRKICVIGAGIIGVSTAVCIQERIPNAEVTIMAADFSPNLTTDVAAGLMQPVLCSGDDPKKVLEWFRQTMEYARRYMKEAPNGGCQEMSGYFFQRDKYDAPFWGEVHPNFRRMTPAEVAEKHTLPQMAGFSYTTLYMQPTKNLAWLMAKFYKNGGKVIQKKLEELSEIGLGWDLVVNCTGLGAKHLVGDNDVVPIRGQIIRVRAPHVKHFFFDDDFHTLLNDDCLILGGTKGYNEWDLDVDKETAKKIFEGNLRNVPALQDAEILSHHVGLRPSRSKIRIEADEITIKGSKIPVVHNYGHGGSGITLCWGTALEATKLVQERLGVAKL